MQGRKKEGDTGERERERYRGERQSEREGQGRKRDRERRKKNIIITNTKKFMEFFILSCFTPQNRVKHDRGL